MTRAMPARHEMHLYRFGLQQSDEVIAQLRMLLSEDEQQRADRFHFEHLRQHFTVARGRLRQTLSAYVGLAPEAIGFIAGEQGKPALAIDSALRFNLSHSGDQMLLVISQGVEVGIDIEAVKSGTEIESLSRRFFTPAETDAILALDGEQRCQAFFACWTRKEAVIKAQGSGLSFGLGRFAVSVPPDGPQLSIDSTQYDFSQWTLLNVPVPSAYHAAVAAQAEAMILVDMEAVS